MWSVLFRPWQWHRVGIVHAATFEFNVMLDEIMMIENFKCYYYYYLFIYLFIYYYKRSHSFLQRNQRWWSCLSPVNSFFYNAQYENLAQHGESSTTNFHSFSKITMNQLNIVRVLYFSFKAFIRVTRTFSSICL